MSNFTSQYNINHLTSYLDNFLNGSTFFVAVLINDSLEEVDNNITINDLINLEITEDDDKNYSRQLVTLNPATIVNLKDEQDNLILDEQGNSIPVATATANKITFEAIGGQWQPATHVCYLREAELTAGSTQGEIVRIDKTLEDYLLQLDHEEKFNCTPTFRMAASLPDY